MRIVARNGGGKWIRCPGSKDLIFINHRVEDAFPLFACQLPASICKELTNLADMSDKLPLVQEWLKFAHINTSFQIHLKKSYVIFRAIPCVDNEYVAFVKTAERLQKVYGKIPGSIDQSGTMVRLFEEMLEMLPDRDAASAEIIQVLRDTQSLSERWRRG